jgi:hypothetical protein
MYWRCCQFCDLYINEEDLEENEKIIELIQKAFIPIAIGRRPSSFTLIPRMLTKKKEKKKATHLKGKANKARRNGINESMRGACVYAVVPCFVYCDGMCVPGYLCDFFDCCQLQGISFNRITSNSK